MKIGPLILSFEGGKRNSVEDAKKPVADSDAKRPVKFVPDGVNSWRVVWADDVAPS